MMLNKTTARAVAALAGLAISGVAMAQDYDWLAAVDGNWNDMTKWSPAGVPNGGGNSASILATGAAYTVTLNINAAVDDFLLDSPDATLFSSGRTLTVANTATFNQGEVRFNSGGLAGGGAGINRGSLLVNGSANFALASFANEGSFNVEGAPGLSATFNFGNTAFTNSGTLSLNSSGNGASTLLGAAMTNTGSISILEGSGSGRTVSVLDLDNEGSIDILANTSFNGANGVTTTTASGSFNTMTGFGATLSNGHDFELAGGTINNDGSLELNGGNSVFRFGGGTINGNAVQLVNSSLVTSGSGTGAVEVIGNVGLQSDVAGGLDIDVLGVPGLSSTLNFGVTAFTNTATINMDSTGNGNSTFAGTTFTNDGTFNVLEGSGTSRTISVLDFDNLASLNLSANTTFNGANGVTTIAPSGSLVVDSGFKASFGNGHDLELNGGVIDNNGAIELSGGNSTLIFNGGAINGNAPVVLNANLVTTGAGTGTIDVVGSSTLQSDVAGGLNINVLGIPGLSTTLNFGATPFSSAATINMDSTGNGNSSFVGSTFTNNGDFNILEGSGSSRTVSVIDYDNNANLMVAANTAFNGANGVTTTTAAGMFGTAAGFKATFANGHDFELDGGTVNNNGAIEINGGNSTLIFNGGVINGNAPVVLNANLVTTGAGTGSIDVYGSSSLQSNVAGGLNINILGIPGLSTTLNFGATPFSSAATINMSSTGNGNSAFVGTTFTNDGDFNILAGSGTTRTVAVNSYTNNGNLMVSTDAAFTGSNGSTSIEAAGTMGVGAGNLAEFSNGHDLHLNGGVINNQGALRLTGGNSEFFANGGFINGNAVEVRSGRLSNTAPTAGVVKMTGSATLVTDVLGGLNVTIAGLPGLSATLSFGAAASSAGVINLTSDIGANGNSSLAGSGLFTNSGVFNVMPGSGTGRTITAGGFENSGDFNAMASVAVNLTNAAWRNGGELFIAPEAVVTLQGGGVQTFDNDDNGIVSGDGTLDLRQVENFINDGVFDPQGSLSVLGDWSQSTDADLAIHLAGSDMGVDYDVLEISLDASLLGDLEITIASGFTPAASDVFTILTARMVAGMFENANTTVQTVDGRGSFDVIYNADSVQLTNFVVPAPATTGLLGTLGLLATRRRRA